VDLAARRARERIERLKKRTAALAFLALLLALVAGTFLVLRTAWAGEKLCALAASRAQAATGLAVAYRACRVDPISLDLVAEAVRLGPADAPLFTAEVVEARLVPIQALGGRLHLAHLRAVRPSVRAELPEGSGSGGTCPPAFLAELEVQRLEIVEGALDLALPGGLRLVVDRLDVSTRPSQRSLRALASPLRRLVVDASAEGARLDGVDARPFTLAHASAEVDLALDLSAAAVAVEAEVDGVRLAARGRLDHLCAPTLDLAATAAGSIRDVLVLARLATDGVDAAGTVAVQARIAGPASAPHADGTISIENGRIDWFTAGDVRAKARLVGGELAIDAVAWPSLGGKIAARGSVGLSAGVRLDAQVEVEGVDLAEILERVGVEGSWVTVKLDGRGRVGGTLDPVALAGTLAADFRDLRALTRSWRVAPASEPAVVQVKRGRLQTGIRVTEEEIAFAAARVSAGRGTSEVDAVARFSEEGGFSVRWRGQVDLDAMGSIAEIPWAGLAQVDGTIAAAPYGNPRIVARSTRVEGFRFLDLDLGNVSADLSYGPDFLLRIEGGQGVKGQSRYRGEWIVDLEPVPVQVLSSNFEGKGRIRDLLEAVRDYLPSTRVLRDHVDGEVEVSGTASGPAGFLDGSFEARLGRGTLLGRAFHSGRAAGTFHRGEEARLERAELRRGTGTIRAAGKWGFLPPFPWDLRVEFEGVPLEALDLPGGGWAGSASGTASLAGSLEHPDVRFAANADAVSLGGVALGSVQVGGTVQERRLVATATSDAMRLEGEAMLEGRLPFHARARLALEDVARLLPGGAAAGIRARVRGEASAEGELEDLAAARARVRLDAVEIRHAELKVEAAAPVEAAVARGRIDFKRFVLRGPNTELTLSGGCSASGELDVAAGGRIDLRLLAGLLPELRRPHGLLALEAHVSGTLPEPVLVGAGRIEDAGFQLKATNVLLSELRGALAFSQNRVLFDDLSAAVNGGRVALRGEVELASFVPVRLRVEAKLDEVPVAMPAWLPATLSGRLEAAGTPDETIVTGRIHVVRARYTANVELEKGLLELRRRPTPPPRPYDRAGEWLRFDVQIAVDGDARVENDLVSGDVRGELVLTGTLAAPGLVGSLALREGGRAYFRGNEFVLTHAIFDFTDRNKIEIALDVHGESQVRDYQIFMHAFGPLSDPQLTLTSTPALSQPDVITLLSLGFTRRDVAAGAGMQGVATAAAAQALFAASGLDEQVKRFLPRGKRARDFNVRITSERSELTGQIEPRAEFESWLLQDRVRLRYQAPLSGARGQRAQAELRLGRHTALQYQWDNDNPDQVATGDHGIDLKLRWEWTDE
jgi:translocation and assembly module TamB